LTNVLEFLDKVSGCVNSGDSEDIIFLDFTKAFDKVSHRKLVLKLQAHGIEGKLLDRIIQCLNTRLQWVCVRGIVSDKIMVLSGVPKGSVLGPMSFFIFIDQKFDLEISR